jgi:hypothetical protein
LNSPATLRQAAVAERREAIVSCKLDFQAGEDGGWMEDRRRKYTGIRLT